MILLKLLLIGLIGVASFFGLSEIFKFKGQTNQPTDIVQELPERLPKELPNETINWAKRIPIKDLWNMVAGGVKGTVMWLIDGINMILKAIIEFIRPEIQIPSWFGWVIVIFLGSLLFWKGLGSLYDIGFTFGKWLTLIIGIFIGILFFAMILGLI